MPSAQSSLKHKFSGDTLRDPKRKESSATKSFNNSDIVNEEEVDDIDAIINDLESEADPLELELEEKEAKTTVRVVPDEHLQTNVQTGLTSAEAKERQKRYGLNKMKEEKENLFLKFLMFFVGPIQFVMEAAAILAAGLQDWVDFGVICGLLLLNACVGFVQEYQAGSIVDELKKTLALKAVVVRDGRLTEIEAPHVVPGDILQLEEGTIVPADGRIVTEAFLQVDQSSITGESLAVEKRQGDSMYASSSIKRGTAFMVITATGDNTFVGQAAALVSKASAGSGHFTEVLNGIGAVLLSLVVFTLLVIWIASFYRSTPIVHILEFTLAITIVGVPVGLPAVVTTTMAVGAAYLAKKKAIVQKLSAIESLAGVEILCSDKTGTLTKNKLSLAEPYTVEGIEDTDLMVTACLAASRKALDAIDKAFLKSLKYYPRAKALLSSYKLLEFFPFDPVSKKVTAIVESPEGERITCVKGAPLFVLKLVEDEVPEHIITAYQEKVAEFASRGFRSLGVARKRSDRPWEILGIMPCSDPPRHDTARTINEAKALGLSIKMLTGDAVGIAKETSRQLGLGTNIYDADRLGLGGGNGSDMSGSEVYDFVEGADGFAEVFPQHKYDVVEILQQRGYLVAMTGDGVNDAPSLKKADTGIAVEGSSDAARAAADIVFLAPGLSAIIDALKTSRQIFHRMYAYVVYRIALSIHLEIFLGLWIVILNESLSLNLVVFIAIFADIATLAIAYDNAPYSKTPVKWNLPKLWGISVLLGMVLAIGTWITLTTMLVSGNKTGDIGGIVQNYGNRDEVLFLQIALTENWLIFITRANGPFWSSIPSWQLSGAVLVVDIIASLFAVFGWFAHEHSTTNIVTIIRVWVLSFGIFCVMGGVYYLLQGSVRFDNLMHGRSRKQRTMEDFLVSMQRVSKQHEKGV
ncbi:hypothetical protein AA313_de0203644 [Arthrobotrys entomopaga]|nr:hypothetical protein AA313_de0203644 [Arthrobotrys entomopaga]